MSGFFSRVKIINNESSSAGELGEDCFEERQNQSETDESLSYQSSISSISPSPRPVVSFTEGLPEKEKNITQTSLAIDRLYESVNNKRNGVKADASKNKVTFDSNKVKSVLVGESELVHITLKTEEGTYEFDLSVPKEKYDPFAIMAAFEKHHGKPAIEPTKSPYHGRKIFSNSPR